MEENNTNYFQLVYIVQLFSWEKCQRQKNVVSNYGIVWKTTCAFDPESVTVCVSGCQPALYLKIVYSQKKFAYTAN